MDDTLRSQFNQIIAKHYERLTGSKNATGGLSLTIDNIGLFILLGGRELEMMDINSQVTERYTMDEFLQEAKDMGIENDEHFQAALQEMIEKKYIEQLPDGHIHTYQDTKDTARMLNRIFPKMQGINLLAYLLQTVAEAESGRTDLESALSRFDQTLNNHGVAPQKPKIPVITPSPKPEAQPQPQQHIREKKEVGLGPRRSNIIRDYVVSKAPPKAAPAAKKPAAPASETGHEEPAPPTPAPTKEDQAHVAPETDKKIIEETEAMKQKIAELEKALADAEKEKQAASSEEAEPVKKEEPVEATAESKTETPAEVVDDEIAKKIEAFEKELALVCPICKTGILQEKTTAAGKVFYACQAEHCNFISWGKPHNIQCVRCKNPFLVEVTEPSGQIILRCPRATCQHRQPLSAGGGTKVVRKRLVRRKK